MPSCCTSFRSPHAPFHLPGIPRPQEEYSISVDNSDDPFQHSSLQRTSSGDKYIHPLEYYSASDFVDRNIKTIHPSPLPLTPFTLIEDVFGLLKLQQALQCEREFAVDLEHNQYRSFLGLTCLMQISTRKEDFVIDVLKLNMVINRYLGDIFMDPNKTKVMHGATNDILWLQRDFDIYMCNLFDTAQASIVLGMEGNSLSHLMSHYCGVTANKYYQTADWRQRPLPDEMIKYAREDTHYLLYIYDAMRADLLVLSYRDDLLLEAYYRSYDICIRLYEKPHFKSYLHIHGLKEANLDAKQLAAAAALHMWRDDTARVADESIGYILPNSSLIDIAKQVPLSIDGMPKLQRYIHPYVEKDIHNILAKIKDFVEEASFFEGIIQQLKIENGGIVQADNRLLAVGAFDN